MLTQLDAVKLRLAISFSDDDVILRRAIEAVSARFDIYCNRAFGRVEPGGVEIDWILETRGHDHLAELVLKLREKKIRVQTFENV